MMKLKNFGKHGDGLDLSLQAQGFSESPKGKMTSTSSCGLNLKTLKGKVTEYSERETYGDAR